MACLLYGEENASGSVVVLNLNRLEVGEFVDGIAAFLMADAALFVPG